MFGYKDDVDYVDTNYDTYSIDVYTRCNIHNYIILVNVEKVLFI